jgi:outer membrane protein assembly factor BamC
MMQARSFFIVGAMILAVMPGCSWLTDDEGIFRDRQGDYLVAPMIEPIRIPPELDSYTLDELYVVPADVPVDMPYFLETPPPRPLDSNVREGVVVQRFGDRRWIVIGAEPSQVWPRMRDYWSTAQIRLSFEDPVRTIMESDWLGDEPDARNKYQVRIEPGLHPGNSEVYVVQVSESYVEDVSAPINWPTVSASLELEHRLLDDISLYLADRTDLYRASSVSLLAGSIVAESKASIVPSAAGDTLHLRIDFDRAWSQVTQALNNAEIETVSSDRSAAVFTVSYDASNEEEDSPGFFARLFGGGDSMPTGQQFLLKLLERESHITVEVEFVSGSEDMAAELADQLIRLVHRNLI